MFIGLTAPAFAASFEQGQRPFEGWIGACRMDGYCSASTGASVEAEHLTSGAILRVARQAEQTYWEVSLTTIAAPADERYPIVATVDKDRIGEFSPPTDIGAFGSRIDFYFLGSKAQALMDRLVAGKSLTFDFMATDNTAQRATFRLAGLAQALIWIDTAQHRIGSERVAEAPPYGLFRTDLVGAAWMEPALAYFFFAH